MLSQTNLSSNATDSLTLSDYGPSDVGLSFLPLAHVYERTLDYVYLFSGVSIAYVDAPERLPQALLEVRPTISGAVPRVFEKLYSNIMQKGRENTGAEAPAFRLGHRCGQPRKAVERLRKASRLGAETGMGSGGQDRLFENSRRAWAGASANLFPAGRRWPRNWLNFSGRSASRYIKATGLTETSPVIAVNVASSQQARHRGPADRKRRGAHRGDGEILTRGPLVMKGYYKRLRIRPQRFRRMAGWPRAISAAWIATAIW